MHVSQSPEGTFIERSASTVKQDEHRVGRSGASKPVLPADPARMTLDTQGEWFAK
jgi:hypothetical protein